MFHQDAPQKRGRPRGRGDRRRRPGRCRLRLTPDEERQLYRETESGNTRRAGRANIIFGLDSRWSDAGLAANLGTSRTTVRRWRVRFLATRSLDDLPRRRGRRERALRLATGPPPAGAPRWTADSLARAARVGLATAWRALREAGLGATRTRPHTAAAADRLRTARHGPLCVRCGSPAIVYAWYRTRRGGWGWAATFAKSTALNRIDLPLRRGLHHYTITDVPRGSDPAWCGTDR